MSGSEKVTYKVKGSVWVPRHMLNYEDKIRKKTKHTLYGTRFESAVMKIGTENSKMKKTERNV